MGEEGLPHGLEMITMVLSGQTGGKMLTDRLMPRGLAVLLTVPISQSNYL